MIDLASGCPGASRRENMRIVNRTISSLAVIATLLATSEPAFAQEACQAQVDELNAVTSRFSDEQTAIQHEAEDIEGDSHDGVLSGTVDIRMNEQRWAFDLPTATMHNRVMSLDLPQVSMRPRAISWSIPVNGTRRIKIGQRPEMTCHGLHCTVHWRDIYANVPTIEMRRQEIRLDVPEFRVARTQWTMGVPEFRMARQEWIVKIPQVTIHDLHAEARDLEHRGQDLSGRADALAERMRTATTEAAAHIYQCHRDDLNAKRLEVAAQFDQGIGQLDGAIASLRAQGIDPAAASMDGQTVDLVAQRQQLVSGKDAALAQIDEAAAQIDTQQRQLTGQIVA
jgi:hypothetical protein